MRRQRDLVFVDLRGTGDSAPLECPDPGAEPLLWHLASADAAACLRSLDADVRFYAHEHALNDLEAVRAGLGYDRINLWGGSYGTRAALLYALAHPDRVRTVTLDGAVPLEQRFPLSTAADGQRALDLLVARCAADPACNAPYPKLSAEIAALFERLQQPVTVVIAQSADGQGLAAVDRLAHGRQRPAQLPLLAPADRVDAVRAPRAAGNNWAPLFAMLAEISNTTVDTMALGMTLSVLCTEDVPRINPGEATDAIRSSWMGKAEIGWWSESCAAWPRHDVPAIYRAQPSPLPMPALILSGEADPATPPRWGDAMTRHFSRAQHVVVRAAHNTSFTGCVPALITDFVTRGSGETLDTTCLDPISWPPFTTGTGRTTAMIRVNGLRKQFGAVVAVNDVTFAAPNGAVTAVLGPNGAGKTTSLRMITGLLRPTDGAVDVDGIDPHRDPVGARRRLGVLPDGAGLYGRLTALEHLQYAARLAGLSGTEARAAIDRVTQVFGLGALARRAVTGFSQGEQRRVALARAVIHDPPNVLLDEPTGALDVLAARAVRALVRQLADRGHARGDHHAHHVGGRSPV